MIFSSAYQAKGWMEMAASMPNPSQSILQQFVLHHHLGFTALTSIKIDPIRLSAILGFFISFLANIKGWDGQFSPRWFFGIMTVSL